jgi:F0F1-type ATP synthase membrane subunit a
MDLKSLIPDIMTHTIHIGSFNILQSLISSLLWTAVFVLLIFLYRYYKKHHPYSYGIQCVDICIETVYEALATIGWPNVWTGALLFTTTIFFFVFWHNFFGLIGDMIVLVRPAAHHVFRPVTTDLIFNGVLAIIAVVWSVIYGFVVHGRHHIAKYFPLHGMGIVPEVVYWYDYITKWFDIILWLLIGIIEFIGEFGRMMSLALRLFGNMFVGMILLSLLLYATKSVFHYPFLLPIIIFAYELCVCLLQAFIFSLLTTVYCKLSADHH